MPTKQELIDMMENHLPGEPVLDIGNPKPPPSYPSLQEMQPPGPQQQQNEQVTFRQSEQNIYAIAHAPINHPPNQFGARPSLAYCPSCRAQLLTSVQYQNSVMTHIIAMILCCTTCSCCLPYLFDSCKTARHYCPECHTYLGAEAK